MSIRRPCSVLIAAALLVAACGHVSSSAAPDAGSDAGGDADIDSDAGADSDTDVDSDATTCPEADTSGALLSVWGSSSGDVYAGGDSVLLHGSGASWEPVPLEPEILIAGDIHGSAWNSVFVSEGWSDGWPDNRIYRFDGESWESLDGPATEDDPVFIQVIWVFDIYDVFALSTIVNLMIPTSYYTWTSHFDGAEWTSLFIDAQQSYCDGWKSYEEMAGTGDGHMFAVGLNPPDSFFAAVFDGTEWWLEEVPEQCLHGVWALDDENVWAVGDDGAILRRGDAEWAYEDAPTSARLDGIYGWSADELVAVGDGVILRRIDGAWELEASPIAGAQLNGVWGSGPDDAYAVGGLDGGALILHFDGAAWSVVYGG